jgi:hypothetical protein
VSARASATRRSGSAAARWRAAAWRRLAAAGSASSSRRSRSTSAWAWRWQACKLARRRNDPAPAAARTRTPSWATRSRDATPVVRRAAKLSTSNASSTGPWATRKSASVLWFMPAAQPLERQVLLAQPGQRAGAADPLDRRVQPQRHQQAGVGRRMAGPPFDGLDPGVERREVEPFDEPPHQADPVPGRDQLVEAERAQLDLAPLRGAQAQPAARRGRVGSALGQLGEQPLIHGHHQVSMEFTMNLPHLAASGRALSLFTRLSYRL